MCLETEWKNPRMAKSDIVVWKHLEKWEGTFYTTYYNMEIELGKIYKSKLDQSDEWGGVEIGLHSFKLKKEAVEDGQEEDADVVVKCIIPKGAKYYKGTFGNFESYVSNSIMYTTETYKI